MSLDFIFILEKEDDSSVGEMMLLVNGSNFEGEDFEREFVENEDYREKFLDDDEMDFFLVF